MELLQALVNLNGRFDRVVQSRMAADRLTQELDRLFAQATWRNRQYYDDLRQRLLLVCEGRAELTVKELSDAAELFLNTANYEENVTACILSQQFLLGAIDLSIAVLEEIARNEVFAETPPNIETADERTDLARRTILQTIIDANTLRTRISQGVVFRGEEFAYDTVLNLSSILSGFDFYFSEPTNVRIGRDELISWLESAHAIYAESVSVYNERIV